MITITDDETQIDFTNTSSGYSAHWAGAGAVICIHTKEDLYFLITRRNNLTSVFEDQLWTTSGRIEQRNKFTPKQASVRESAEETLLYNKQSQKWILPYFEDKQLSTVSENAIKRNTKKLTQVHEHVSQLEYTLTPATRFEITPAEETTLKTKNQEQTVTGLIVTEPTRKTTDYIDILYIDCREESIKDIVPFDGEMLDTEHNDSQREIYLFTKDQFFDLLNQPVTAERVYKNGAVYTNSKKTEVSYNYDEGVRITEVIPVGYLLGKIHPLVEKRIKKLPIDL